MRGKPIDLSKWNNAHPLVQELVAKCKAAKISLTELSKKAGVDAKVPYRWRRTGSGSLALFCLHVEALGYEVVIQPKAPKPNDNLARISPSARHNRETASSRG